MREQNDFKTILDVLKAQSAGAFEQSSQKEFLSCPQMIPRIIPVMKHYEIKAYSAWQRPQTFIVDTENEREELILALKDQQYKVEWEEIFD